MMDVKRVRQNNKQLMEQNEAFKIKAIADQQKSRTLQNQIFDIQEANSEMAKGILGLEQNFRQLTRGIPRMSALISKILLSLSATTYTAPKPIQAANAAVTTLLRVQQVSNKRKESSSPSTSSSISKRSKTHENSGKYSDEDFFEVDVVGHKKRLKKM
jgi:hypothetical protein